MLIDTHCHLDASEFDHDREQVIARLRLAGVASVVIPAVEVANFETVRKMAGREPGFVYALGIHPLYVDRAQDDAIEQLRNALVDARGDPALVAVGEIGLDHFVPGLDLDRQTRFFQAQLKLAAEFDLPVILHVRRALDTVLKHLRRAGLSGGIAHAFNGSVQQAQAFISLGFALGFGGAMTFERALRIRDLAATLPDEAFVLETDAPDISPSWVHPGRNEPGELAGIAETLASLRRQPVRELVLRTAANARRVLPRLEMRVRPGAAAVRPGG
jgi:TatD DNase family protein